MPYSATWEPRGVHCKFSGSITAGDVRLVTETVGRSAKFDHARYCIVDYLDVREFGFTDAELDSVIAARISSYYASPSMRIAFVSTDPKMLALIARDTADGQLPSPFKVFSSLEEARAWGSADPLVPGYPPRST